MLCLTDTSAKFRANLTLTLRVLQNFSPGALTLNLALSSRVLDAHACLATEEYQCEVRCKGESLDQIHVVKQRPGRTSGAGVHARERTKPIEGITSRPGHCFLRVFADSERDPRWLAPCAPSGVRLRGKGP